MASSDHIPSGATLDSINQMRLSLQTAMELTQADGNEEAVALHLGPWPMDVSEEVDVGLPLGWGSKSFLQVVTWGTTAKTACCPKSIFPIHRNTNNKRL